MLGVHMGTRKPKNPPPEDNRDFPQVRFGPSATASSAPKVHQTATKPAVLRCPKCGQSVVTLPAAEARCLPCGVRMLPVRGKGKR